MAAATTTRPEELETEVIAEVEDFHPIEKMEALGINKGDIKKARDANFFTCDTFLMQTTRTLSQIKGLSEAKIEKMIVAAKQICGPAKTGFRSARLADEERERDIAYISSGCAAVDEILGGGFETKAITEIYGEFRCGKTQLCHTLCVTAQVNDKSPGKVAYIDTEGTFRASRIRPIAARYNLQPEDVLDNIACARAFTWEQQFELLDAAAGMMIEAPFKMLIIDSIMGCLRTDFSGRGELAERQQRLGQLMTRLRKVAEEYNVAVVITNQVMSDPSGGAMFVSDPKKPVGGHVMAHNSTIRLSVRKGKAEQRLIKVVQSPNLSEMEASFAISNEGVIAYKD